MEPELERYLDAIRDRLHGIGMPAAEVRARVQQARTEIERQRAAFVNRGIIDDALARAIRWHETERAASFFAAERPRPAHIPGAFDYRMLLVPPGAPLAPVRRPTHGTSDARATAVPAGSLERLAAFVSPMAQPALAVAESARRGHRPRSVDEHTLAASGFFIGGVIEGIQSEVTHANAAIVQRELNEIFRAGQDGSGFAFAVGVGWSVVEEVESTIALVEYVRTFGQEDLRAVQRIVGETIRVLVAGQYQRLAREVGFSIGASEASELVQAFTSTPPPWVPSWLRPSWRSIELGRLLGPIITAVISASANLPGMGTVAGRVGARIGLAALRQMKPALNVLARLPGPRLRGSVENAVERLARAARRRLPDLPDAGAAGRRLDRNTAATGVPDDADVSPTPTAPLRREDDNAEGGAPRQPRTARVRADEFLRRPEAQKLTRSPDTVPALEDIFRRSSGESSTGRGQTFLARRAAAAELQTIVRYLRQTDVESVQLIRATTRGRTPDVTVTYRPPRQPRVERVEITAATQASRSARPTRGQLPPRSVIDEGTIEHAVLRKARHSPQRPSQLAVRMQGVPTGGAIVVNLTFYTRDAIGMADRAIPSIVELSGFPHVTRIEVSYMLDRSDTTMSARRGLAVYERQADGSYPRRP